MHGRALTLALLVLSACSRNAPSITADPSPSCTSSCPACPSTTTALPIDPPKSDEKATVVKVTIDAHGEVTIDGSPAANDAALLALVHAHDAATIRATIYADEKVTHGRVIHVLDLLQSAGVSKISFAVTKTP